MSKRKILLLLIAFLIAGITAIVARGMLSSKGSGTALPESAAQITEVIVAAHDLPSGTMIKESDLKWQAWPLEASGSGYAVKGKAEISDYYGNVVRYGMRASEPLLAGRIVKAGEQGFMAAALAPGMRAISISVTPVSGVAGFIFPGDRVDVIVTHEIGRKTDIDPSGRKVSETMLRNVRVLALDQKMSDQITEPKVAQIVTLEVTAKQAETVALASEMGTLSLTLRSIASGPEQERKAADDAGIALAEEDDQEPELTWDSDVSQVLRRPVNRAGATQKITIIRGQEATESLYELTQP